MNGTYGEENAAEARYTIEHSARAFSRAAAVLRELCLDAPNDAGNFSVRFEAYPDPRFVFSKSAQCLYYYEIPTEDLEAPASPMDIALGIQYGWEALDG